MSKTKSDAQKAIDILAKIKKGCKEKGIDLDDPDLDMEKAKPILESLGVKPYKFKPKDLLG
jgi:hypothetical protein